MGKKMKKKLDENLIAVMLIFVRYARRPSEILSTWTGWSSAKMAMMTLAPIAVALRFAYNFLWLETFFEKAILTFFTVILGIVLVAPAWIINKVLEAARDQTKLPKDTVDIMFSFIPPHAWYIAFCFLGASMSVGTIIAGGENMAAGIHTLLIHTVEFVCIIWMWTLTIPPTKSKLRSLIENVTPEPASVYSAN